MVLKSSKAVVGVAGCCQYTKSQEALQNSEAGDDLGTNNIVTMILDLTWPAYASHERYSNPVRFELANVAPSTNEEDVDKLLKWF